MSEKCGVCRILLYRLKVALVVLRFDTLLARRTSYLSRMMIVNTDSSNDTLTFLAFDQETVQTFSGISVSSLCRVNHSLLLKNLLQSLQNFHSTREQFCVMHGLQRFPRRDDFYRISSCIYGSTVYEQGRRACW